MSIEKVDMFKVVCDEPGCGVETFDLGGEFAAWADHGQAIDDWVNGNGQHVEGATYCPAHAKPVCEDCDLIVESLNGDEQCSDCAAKASA